MTRQMAQQIQWDGSVRYIAGEDAEPWQDVLESAGEKCMEGALITIKRVAVNVHDMGADVYRVNYEKPGALTLPDRWTEHYLVGSLAPTEPDWDEIREAREDA